MERPITTGQGVLQQLLGDAGLAQFQRSLQPGDWGRDLGLELGRDQATVTGPAEPPVGSDPVSQQAYQQMFLAALASIQSYPPAPPVGSFPAATQPMVGHNTAAWSLEQALRAATNGAQASNMAPAGPTAFPMMGSLGLPPGSLPGMPPAPHSSGSHGLQKMHELASAAAAVLPQNLPPMPSGPGLADLASWFRAMSEQLGKAAAAQQSSWDTRTPDVMSLPSQQQKWLGANGRAGNQYMDAALPPWSSSCNDNSRHVPTAPPATLTREWGSEAGANSSIGSELQTPARGSEVQSVIAGIGQLSSDERGSRAVIRALEGASVGELDAAVNHVLPVCSTLLKSTSGALVVQRLFELGTTTQRLRLASQLRGNMLQLSVHPSGCAVVEKALEVLGVEERCGLAAELEQHIMRCATDRNGSRVVKQIIQCIPFNRATGTLGRLLANIVQLSTHPCGSRVAQTVLEHVFSLGFSDPRTRAMVVEEFQKHAVLLAQDAYGNYAMQHVLLNVTDAERLQIVHVLAPHIRQLVMDKYASHVVEKRLFGSSCAVGHDLLVSAMLADGPEPSFEHVATSSHGYYTVRKMLQVCSNAQHAALMVRLRSVLVALEAQHRGGECAEGLVSVQRLLNVGVKEMQRRSRSCASAADCQAAAAAPLLTPAPAPGPAAAHHQAVDEVAQKLASLPASGACCASAASASTGTPSPEGTPSSAGSTPAFQTRTPAAGGPGGSGVGRDGSKLPDAVVIAKLLQLLQRSGSSLGAKP